MVNNKSKSMLLMLVLSVAIVGCSKKEEVSSANIENAVPVQVDVVKEGTVDAKAGISGKLAPNESVQVAPKVNGKITKIHVSLGQQVKQGDLLFDLDQSDLANAVKQAQAAVSVAAANLKQAENSSIQGVNQAEGSVVQTNNSILQAQNGLAQAQVGLTQAQQSYQDAITNEQRVRQLFDAGAVPTVEMEKAETAVKNAETAVKNAELAVKNAETNISNAQSSYENAQKSLKSAQSKTAVEVARASLNQAQVNLQNARDQLANASVRAPISGVVSLVDGATGQMASPQMAVVHIVNIDPMIVKANLSENELTTVSLGNKVALEIPALKKNLEATVSAISPVMDSQLKAYPIEISIPNPTGELKADMVVNVKVSSASTVAKSLVIPRKAVIEEQGKRYVYKLDGDVATKVEVQTGQETSESVEILSGLQLQDQVVVKGQTLLQDGSRIQIQDVK